MSKYNKMKSRKWILTLVIISIATVLSIIGKMSGSDWVMAATIAAGIYEGANVAQKKMTGGNYN